MLNLKSMRKTIACLVLILMTASLVTVGCGDSGRSKDAELEITIAEQYGLPYAPLQIVKEQNLLEKNLPGLKVNWRQLGNTTAIREAMVAGEIDAGFMAIPPFLVGWDKGMAWKIACGLSQSPVGLVTNKEDIRSLADFTPKDRIALPQPGSVQHILLAMACENYFNDSHKLDNLLVTMAHPDGMNALLARREITAHFTTPPYLSRELEKEGMRLILDGKEAMGEEFSFIVGVTTAELYQENPQVYQAFVLSIEDAIVFMKNYPGQTASLLAKAYGMQEKEIVNYLKGPQVEYSLEVQGIMRFAEFMQRNGYLTKVPAKAEDVLWENKTGK